ncbi:MAG: polysaccharide biosynthesis tyrosine autokinase [Pseudolabrys sp.]|nr:polysaccharide biosynthesis tyrosine autokinase [Pseudolabrys sp.]
MLNRLPVIGAANPIGGFNAIDLHDVLNFIWRQWLFIATVLAATLIVGAVLLMRQMPLYTASAEILLDSRRDKLADPVPTDLVVNVADVQNQMEIIRSTALLRRVVEKENLAPGQPVDAAPASGRGGSVSRPGADTPAEQAVIDLSKIPAQAMRSIQRLKAGLEVTRSKGHLITVSFTSPDPQRSARLANAIASGYIVDKLDTRYEGAKRAAAWLSERLAELRNQVRQSEMAVQKFREDHNLLQGTANITLNQQQLADLNARLLAARADMSEKKARLDLLKSVDEKGGDVQRLLPDMVNSPLVATLRGQLAVIKQRESDLVARYGNGHPLVVNVRSERRDVERSLAGEIQKLAANVRNEYEIAKARADSLETSLREVTGQVGSSNSAVVILRELERTVEVNRTLFEDFLKKARITQEQSTFEIRDARIITPALPPSGPSSPNKTRHMTVVALLGLFLGFGGALTKELLNTGFTTPKEVEDLLEIPLLSSISSIEPGDLKVGGKSYEIPHLPAVKPLGRFSESIRAVRSGIQMSDVDHPPKVVQVTSTVPGEGKTTIALAVAASAAVSGLRVLYVDADLRRPSGSSILTDKKNAGLVDLLLGQTDAPSAIDFSDEFRFWYLSAGSRTQSPMDLLSSDRMKSFMESFRKSFDFIVVDSPPVGPVVDAVAISKLADKVVYVVRWSSTAREMVKHSIERLSADKRVAGVVFNRVNEKIAQKYGKYAYSYYYSGRYYRNYYTE